MADSILGEMPCAACGGDCQLPVDGDLAAADELSSRTDCRVELVGAAEISWLSCTVSGSRVSLR
jgi:hypothetical protein